jgi:uncharacterized membrane protein YfcA
VAAAVSSVAGFAFSALAGAALFHLSTDTLHAVQVMLIASIAIQAYSVWQLRTHIKARPLVPFFAGGAATVLPGVLLLLHAHTSLYSLVLGAFLIAYAMFMLAKPSFRLPSDGPLARFAVGALGGLTGALAAFPGAFITIWCGAQDWDKRQQRAIYQPFILGMQLLTITVLAAIAPARVVELDLFSTIASVPATSIDQNASSSVTGIAGRTALATGCCVANDRPRSPCSARANQSRYWMYAGRSKPCRAFSAAIASGVAFSPSIIVAGLPSSAVTEKNSRAVMARTVGMATSSRRTRKLSMAALSGSNPPLHRKAWQRGLHRRSKPKAI